MATINQFFSVPPKESEEARQAKMLLEEVNLVQVKLLTTFEYLYKGLWHSSLDPRLVLAEMGTNAVSFFMRASAFVTFMQQHVGITMDPSEYTPPFPLEFHPDGRVTIIE